MPAPVYETLISRRLLKLAFRAVQQACTEMLAVVLKTEISETVLRCRMRFVIWNVVLNGREHDPQALS
jgi:hypothetical protein